MSSSHKRLDKWPEMTLKSVSDTDKIVVPLTDIERLRGRVSFEEALVNGIEMKKTHSKREMYLDGRNVEQIYRKKSRPEI